MQTMPKVHEFDVAVDRDGTASSGLGGASIPRDDAWWAEHFVLAGLVRCTVTKRDADGLYGFVEIESRFDVDVSPAPERGALVDLLDRTERGCFVGNSLTERPRYRWTVNGEEIR
jgi:hypothetical protein